MIRTIHNAIGSFILAATLVAAVPFVAHAQTQPAVCANPTSEDIAQACRDYAAETAKLKELQAQLNAQKQKTGAFQSNVNSLISKINSTQAKIRSQISAIGNLSQQIGQKTKAIQDLEQELNREHASLQQLLKRTNEIDQKGSVYVLLSSESVSDFYQDLDNFLSIKRSLYASVNKVREIKGQTEEQKEQLKSKQALAVDAKNALESEKKKIEQSKSEAQKLLDTSKTEEQKRQALVAEQQKKVAQIESKLFSFAGGATKAIPFKDAYEYAKRASAATGVRPAFILATLTQESNLGANVGTCNRAGDPPSKSYTVMMHPTRDIPPFLRITKALGMNPDTTPISCRIGNYGWGGAMGPSQFIPSTWVAYEAKVAAALGKATANPWIAQDAIMATAMLHRANGGVGSETKERTAACRYYAGGTACTSVSAFYGNSVMALARSIQADIDYLEQYGVSRR